MKVLPDKGSRATIYIRIFRNAISTIELVPSRYGIDRKKFVFRRAEIEFQEKLSIFAPLNLRKERIMAHHKSALKRIRSDRSKRLRNRYYHKTMRNALREIRSEEDKKKAEEGLPKLFSMIDRLAKRNVIHKKKAGNLKSGLQMRVNKL